LEEKEFSLQSYKQGFSNGYTRALFDMEALWEACWKYWDKEIVNWKNEKEDIRGAPELLGNFRPGRKK